MMNLGDMWSAAALKEGQWPCPDCDETGRHVLPWSGLDFTGEKCERCHGSGFIDLTSAKEMVEC